jgi:hypothetical protein
VPADEGVDGGAVGAGAGVGVEAGAGAGDEDMDNSWDRGRGGFSGLRGTESGTYRDRDIIAYFM